MIKNFPIFDRLFLGEKNSYNNESCYKCTQNILPCQWVTLLDKKFEKISHLRGFISLEKMFPKKVEKFSDFWSPISRWKNNCIITTLSVMYNYVKNMLPRRLVSFLSEFQVLLVVKLSKIGENPENSRKIFVFEANKTAKAKIFSEILYR